MSGKQGKRERARARSQRRAERRVAERHASATKTSTASASDPVCGTEAPTIHDALQWYMVRTEPRMTDRALDGLEKLEVVTIIARVSEIVSRLGRRVVRSRQLLLRTVFVGVRDVAHLDSAAAVSGVASVVSTPREEESEGNVAGFTLRPARLDKKALQNFVDALARDEVVQPFGVKKGDQVVVRSGPFASFPGVVEEMLSGDRVKVGVAIFGRSSPIVLGVAEIEVVA